ncbi:MAG: hypothetical protein WBM32_20890 [Crocosphaera sp.]
MENNGSYTDLRVMATVLLINSRRRKNKAKVSMMVAYCQESFILCQYDKLKWEHLISAVFPF